MVAGRAVGVASQRSCWKFPPCPKSVSSKTDLLLVKAEAIIDGGNTSVITFKQEKSYHAEVIVAIEE